MSQRLQVSPLLAQILTISNFLTVMRLVAAPIMVFLILYEYWWYAFILFVPAAATDLLDGFFARYLGEATELGMLLDPLADKVFFTSSLLALVYVHFPSLPIPAWFVWVVVIREFLIITGAVILMMLGKHTTLVPSWFGKLTTFGYAVLLSWSFACYFFAWMPLKTYYVLLGMVTMSALISLVEYSSRAVRAIMLPETK